MPSRPVKEKDRIRRGGEGEDGEGEERMEGGMDRRRGIRRRIR